jgi:hypothetical protein
VELPQASPQVQLEPSHQELALPHMEQVELLQELEPHHMEQVELPLTKDTGKNDQVDDQ